MSRNRRSRRAGLSPAQRQLTGNLSKADLEWVGNQMRIAGAAPGDAAKALMPIINPNGAMIPLNEVINALTGAAFAGSNRANPLQRDPYDQVPFGPNSPLIPAPINPPRPDTGRAQPRITEYPVSWNLPGGGTRLLPWQILRDASRNIDILRRCIQVRKRHIRSLKWTWSVSTDAVNAAYRNNGDRGKGLGDIEADMRERLSPHIGRLTEFWANPWSPHTKNLKQWINGLLEEHVVLDAVAIYPKMTYGGDVLQMQIIDGTTIKPLLDESGQTPMPPFPAYQQVLYGFPRGEWQATVEESDGGGLVIPNAYPSDQLYYYREQMQPETPYGYSAVEQALISARLYLKRQGWMLAEYDDGTMPQTWLVPEGTVGADEMDFRQRRKWEDALNDELSGNTAARHRVKVTPPGFVPHETASADERYRPEYDLHLIKLLATHMDVTIAELGFTEAKGLGSASYHEGQEDVQNRIGRRPDADVICELITDLSRLYLAAPPELEFTLLGLESEDEAAQDAVDDARVRSGRMVLNDSRKRMGLPLYDFPEADMPILMTNRGAVFLQGASKVVLPGELVEPVQAPRDTVPPEGGDSQASATRVKPVKATTKAATGEDEDRPQDGAVDRIITQLEPDYPDQVLEWVRHTAWTGPESVPLDEVDFSDVAQWEASHQPDKVARFAGLIREGKLKPAIVVTTPGNPKKVVVDGHHRALAYRSMDEPVLAWVGQVPQDAGPWDDMHDSQYSVPSIRTDDTGTSTANQPAAKAAELSAYYRWARRNPNSSRPFVFKYNAEPDLPAAMYQAAARDWIVKADQPPPDGGGGDPKAPPPPDNRWPGWAMDLAVAAYWAKRLRRALTRALGIDALVEAWHRLMGAHRPADGQEPALANAQAWLASQGIDLSIPIGEILTDIYTEGWYVGDRAARAAMQHGDVRAAVSIEVDWGGWKPGSTSAARQVLSADGSDVGLQRLLDDAGITITSIAANRLDELAAVLADGLEAGRTPREIATGLRGILDDPDWAYMTALTETSRAINAAALARYAGNGIAAVEWLTANDQRVCPTCKANAEAGPVPIGTRFPSGDYGPPAHPRCRCAPVPVVARS